MDADSPYLPPAEPTDNVVAPKRKLGRTLVLWLVLIVMFVAIYAVLGDDSAHRHGQPRMPTCEPSPWSWLNGIGFPVGAMGLLILIIMWRQLRGGTKLNVKLEPGLLALADGDVGRAVEVFGSVAHEYRKRPLYATVAKLSLVRAWTRQGQLAKAIEAAVEAERAPGLLFGADVRVYASVDLATLHALRGDVETARRWCESARQRLPRASNRTPLAAATRVAEAIVLARSGQRQEALRALDRDWRRLEEALTTVALKPALLMRAFCAAGDANRVAADPSLALVRKGELSWMAVEWPELQVFLAAQER